MSIDLLAFGPHPDDLEIGLGGTIARHVASGQSVGLCDLTAGELSSNGTPEQRQIEATDAARVLGVLWRETLGWPDGDISTTPAQRRMHGVRDGAQLWCKRRGVPSHVKRHPHRVGASGPHGVTRERVIDAWTFAGSERARRLSFRAIAPRQRPRTRMP